MANEKVIIEVELDEQGVRRGVAKIKSQLTKAGKETEGSFGGVGKGLAGRFNLIAGAINQFKAVAIGAFVSVGAAVAKVSVDFARFEQGLVGIAKTTNIGGDDLAELGNDIEGLARRLPIATGRLLELGQTAGQFGIQAPKDILKFIEVIGQLELATNLAGEEGAQALIRILNVTKQGVKDLDRFASSVVALGNNFETTEAQIVPISNEIARATAVFGVNAQSIAALGTALNTLGARAESSGTAIQRVFVEIDKAIAENNENLRTFADVSGKTVEDFAKDFRGDAFSAFVDFVKGLNKQGLAAGRTISSLGINSQRLRAVLLPLAGNVGRLEEAIALSNREFEANSALSKEATAAGDTLSGSYQRLLNSLGELSTNLGGLLSPAVRGTVDAFAAATQSVNEFFDSFRGDSIGELQRAKDELQDLEERLRGIQERRIGDNVFSQFSRSLREAVGGSDAFLLQQEQELEKLVAVAAQKVNELEAIGRSEGGEDGEESGGGIVDAIIPPDAAQVLQQRLSIINGLLISENQRRIQDIKQSAAVEIQAEQSAFDRRLISFQQFEERKFQIAQSARQAITDVQLEAARSNQVVSAVTNATNQLIVQSFSRLGASLVGAGDGFKGFAQAALGIVGDLLINLGLAALKIGKLIDSVKAGLVSFTGAIPIAAGLALIAAGGLLKSLGTGGLGVPGGAGGGAVAPTPVTEVEPVTGDEDIGTEQRVTVNIQGDVLDSDETGTRIARILQDSFEAEGVQVVRTV